MTSEGAAMRKTMPQQMRLRGSWQAVLNRETSARTLGTKIAALSSLSGSLNFRVLPSMVTLMLTGVSGVFAGPLKWTVDAMMTTVQPGTCSKGWRLRQRWRS